MLGKVTGIEKLIAGYRAANEIAKDVKFARESFQDFYKRLRNKPLKASESPVSTWNFGAKRATRRGTKAFLKTTYGTRMAYKKRWAAKRRTYKKKTYRKPRVTRLRKSTRKTRVTKLFKKKVDLVLQREVQLYRDQNPTISLNYAAGSILAFDTAPTMNSSGITHMLLRY